MPTLFFILMPPCSGKVGIMKETFSIVFNYYKSLIKNQNTFFFYKKLSLSLYRENSCKLLETIASYILVRSFFRLGHEGQNGDQFFDAAVQSDGGPESQPADPGVGHLVVALVLVFAGAQRDLAGRDESLDPLGDLGLGQVHGLVAHVESFA